MRNPRRARQIAVAVAVLGVVSAALAACSSSGKGSSGSGPTSSTAKGTPIVIGTIGSFSGVQASSEGGTPKVLNAWVTATNAAGGINGHPVKLIVKDIGDNAAGGLAAAKELVEQDKVVAIVGEQDNADTTWASYIAGTGVPVVGGLALNIPFATNPDFFPVGANVFALLYGELVTAKTLGGKFGILSCAESPQCASAGQLVSGLAQAVGVQVPVSAKVSATAPDYTALCQQLKSAGVESYQVGSGSAVVVRVTRACAALGLKATALNIDGAATQAWLAEPALDNATLPTSVFPFTSKFGAGPQAYQALLAKYLPNLGALNGQNSATAYASAELFKAAAQGSTGTVTAASLKTALYAMKGETLNGLTPPLTFNQGQPNLVNCYFTMKIENKAFVDAGDGKTTCAPDALVTGILASLK